MERASSNESLRLVPLGGLGEFGLNALVVDWAGHLLLVDAGMMFPSAELPGVDSIVPDFQYLVDRPGALQAILLTHGHEDHIGALPFALQAAPAPVYGSRLTLGFASRRLRERGVEADLRTLVPGVPVEIGPFRVHPIRVAHSVLDSLALAIETPAGVVLASGDFKIEPDAAPEERTDVEALRAWGDRGVLALLSDSTNVEQRGHTGGEDAVVPALREVFDRTRGRVMVSCFATSIPIQRVLIRTRRIGLRGRRMSDNADVAMDPPAAIRPRPGRRGRGRTCTWRSPAVPELVSSLRPLLIGGRAPDVAGTGDTGCFRPA
jgi:ribonuclease J